MASLRKMRAAKYLGIEDLSYLGKLRKMSADTPIHSLLAEIYSGMGCYTAAERCLIRAAARYGLTGSLCYAIGVCALAGAWPALAAGLTETSKLLQNKE